MAATKAKKSVAKKAPAKKPVAKKKSVAKKSVSRSTVVRRPRLVRSSEYTQLTWVLICIWLVLIAIFLGTVVGQWG